MRFFMKKLVSLILSIIVVILLLLGVKRYIQVKEIAADETASSEKQQLYLFNWGNYIDPELIKEFEAETNIQVVYETFDSNDAMEAKLKQGGTRYDNKILLLDGNRETMGLALQSLGYSLNSKDAAQLKEAELKIKSLNPNVRAVLNEEIKTMMKLEEAPIGIGYSGDAAAVAEANPAVQYILPQDGSAVWTDNFALSYNAENIEGAYAFINFMLRPENAAKNAAFVGYATPNEAAKELLDEEVVSDETFYPSQEVIESLEHYEYLGTEWISNYNDAFLNFKMEL